MQCASILSFQLALQSWSLLSSFITLHLQEIVESGSVASDNYTKWESKLGSQWPTKSEGIIVNIYKQRYSAKEIPLHGINLSPLQNQL